MSSVVCVECITIVEDFIRARRAISEEMSQSRLGRDPEFAEAWNRARRLRTEEDVLLAEELFPAMTFSSAIHMNQALRRKLTHEARTGHKVGLTF